MFSSDYLPNGEYISIEFSKLLLKYGAKVNYIRQGYKDEKNRTVKAESPLTIACQTGNLELVKLLVESGADMEELLFTPGYGDYISQTSAL